MNAADVRNAKAIAALFGVTTRRVQQLVTEGVIEREAKGRYNVDQVVPAYIVWLQSGGQTADARASDPNRELAELKVQRTRIEFAVFKKELVDVKVLGLYAEKLGSVMSAALEAMPGQIKQICPHLRVGELKQIRSMIVKVVNGVAAFDVSHSSSA